MRALAAALCLSFIMAAPAAAQTPAPDWKAACPKDPAPLIRPVVCTPAQGRVLVVLNGRRLQNDPPEEGPPPAIEALPPPPPLRRDRGFVIREPYHRDAPLWRPAPERVHPSPEMEDLVRRLSELGLQQSLEARRNKNLLHKTQPPAAEVEP